MTIEGLALRLRSTRSETTWPSIRLHSTRSAAVHRNRDDRYRITQITWLQSKDDWYRYWDGPEMIEFRARNVGRFQVPINYWWHDEIAAGELGPEVPTEPETEPAPEPQTAV